MQYGYWKVRIIQKHKIPASLRHLVPGCFVLALIVLPLVSLWWPLATWAWLGMVVVYALSNVAASFVTAAHHEWILLPLLPFVFACYHLAYGFGFLCGVWDLVIRRHAPGHAFTDLTRPPVEPFTRKTAADTGNPVPSPHQWRNRL